MARLKDMVCPDCGAEFELRFDHGPALDDDPPVTLLIFSDRSSGIYRVEAKCPSCPHRESLYLDD